MVKKGLQSSYFLAVVINECQSVIDWSVDRLDSVRILKTNIKCILNRTVILLQSRFLFLSLIVAVPGSWRFCGGRVDDWVPNRVCPACERGRRERRPSFLNFFFDSFITSFLEAQLFPSLPPSIRIGTIDVCRGVRWSDCTDLLHPPFKS